VITMPIEDTFRRIRNILDVCPAEDLEPEDAREVSATLSLIAHRRLPPMRPGRNLLSAADMIGGAR
jgi:hypothetical protein